MNVWSKYKLTGLVTSTDAWRVYRAEDEADGRQVLVHLLSDKLDPARRLATMTRVVQASISQAGPLRNALLDFGESKGVHGFVTEDRPEYRDLSAFLADPVAASSKQEVAEATRAFTAMRGTVLTASEPGEFTRMFAVPAPQAPQTQAPKAAGAPASEPGEFTKMFKVPSPDLAPGADAKQQRPVQNADDAPTQIMPAFKPETPTPPVSKPVVAAAPPPSDFTSLFRAAIGSTPSAPDRPSDVNPADAQDPSEFTRMFQAPAPPPPASQAPPAAVNRTPPSASGMSTPPAGDFTRMFQSPQATPPAPPPSAVKRTPAAEVSAAQADSAAPPPAGDFTRLFHSPAPPPKSSPPAEDQGALEFDRFHRVPVFDPPPPSLTEQLPVNQPGKDAPPDWFLNPKPAGTPEAPKREMSDFTRVFGTRKADASNPMPAGAGNPAEATSMFDLGARAKSGNPGPSAPSEFTQMLQRPQSPSAAQPAPIAPASATPAPAAAPAAKRSMLPVILIVLAVLAVALIVTVIMVAKKPAVKVPTSVPTQPTMPSRPSLPR